MIFEAVMLMSMYDACALQVGTISANGEREIGDLIARAMEKVRGRKEWKSAHHKEGRECSHK